MYTTQYFKSYDNADVKEVIIFLSSSLNTIKEFNLIPGFVEYA